jgi:XisH protein
MPALDRDHAIVRRALEKDGWTITDDPLKLAYKDRRLQADLGAERLLTAERGVERIAVEIKTFSGPSDVTELHHATGQFIVYQTLLKDIDPTRTLFLAVPDDVLQSLFENDHCTVKTNVHLFSPHFSPHIHAELKCIGLKFIG